MSTFSKLFFTALSLCNIAHSWQTISSFEWMGLANNIEGSVVLPTDDTYASEYVLWASTFDNVYPEAIVKCSTADDVQKAYNLVLAHFEPEIDIDRQIIAVRSGSHSMIGASTTSGVVIDVSGLTNLEISEDGTAIVEPGVNLSLFTAWAEENDVTLPHGDCASVTFGGFLQGGGLGLTSRTFGLGGDWVKSFDMVIASGEKIKAAADNEYSDLFWATIGGGGSQFGIITQYEMNIPEKKQVNPGLYVEITWDYDYDTWLQVSNAWKEFMNNDDYQDHFAMYLRLQPATYLTQDYYVGLHGFWTGEQTTGLLVLAEILTTIDLTPATAKIDYVHFEGWIESSASDRTRYSAQCKSRWALDELNDQFFVEMGQQLEKLMSYEPKDTILTETDDESYVYPTQFMFLSPADGAIQSSDDGSTSFPHRDAKYFFAMCGRWRDGYTNSEKEMKSWLTNTMNSLQPYLSIYSFVSFPDWDLTNWQEAYYRDSYKKLQDIKSKYDPNYMFRYSQSIVPSNWPSLTTNKMQELPLHSDDGSISQWREWFNKQQESDSQNNKKLATINSNNKSYIKSNIKNIELGAFIFGGILVSLAIFHFLCKKKLTGQYTPLKLQGNSYETADETDNIVAL